MTETIEPAAPADEKKPDVMTPSVPKPSITYCKYTGEDPTLVLIGEHYVQPKEIVEAPKPITDYLLRRKDFVEVTSAEEIAAEKKKRNVFRYPDLPKEKD